MKLLPRRPVARGVVFGVYDAENNATRDRPRRLGSSFIDCRGRLSPLAEAGNWEQNNAVRDGHF